MDDARVAVFGASWRRSPHGEMAAAMRSIAGALSRLAAVDVYVPGEGPPVADGAFDLTPVPSPPDAVWAAPRDAPAVPPGYRAVLVEAGDHAACALAASLAPDAPQLSVGRTGRDPRALLAVDLGVDLDAEDADDATPLATRRIGLYARVHPGAPERRHYGLRSVPDYLLVLGDRAGKPTGPWPSHRIRWMLARFARRYVVVVEGGIARVWRSRSCVAAFEVHTRMDLWILTARALGVVDLAPGDVFARECVESLRYGVPVVVPEGSAAEGLVRQGGGRSFSSVAELLSCVDALTEPATREVLASAGRAVADRWYGDPDGLVSRLGEALAAVGAGNARQS